MIIRISYDEVPKDYYTIRLKNTNLYLHFEDSCYVFIPRMYGCLVMDYELAKEIVGDFEAYAEIDELEIKKFITAYKQHGLIEKQIAYN